MSTTFYFVVVQGLWWIPCKLNGLKKISCHNVQILRQKLWERDHPSFVFKKTQAATNKNSPEVNDCDHLWTSKFKTNSSLKSLNMYLSNESNTPYKHFIMFEKTTVFILHSTRNLIHFMTRLLVFYMLITILLRFFFIIEAVPIWETQNFNNSSTMTLPCAMCPA